MLFHFIVEGIAIPWTSQLWLMEYVLTGHSLVNPFAAMNSLHQQVLLHTGQHVYHETMEELKAQEL